MHLYFGQSIRPLQEVSGGLASEHLRRGWQALEGRTGVRRLRRKEEVKPVIASEKYFVE
jgi:hypothetical protein